MPVVRMVIAVVANADMSAGTDAADMNAGTDIGAGRGRQSQSERKGGNEHGFHGNSLNG